jgi:hypothetical protein
MGLASEGACTAWNFLYEIEAPMIHFSGAPGNASVRCNTKNVP